MGALVLSLFWPALGVGAKHAPVLREATLAMLARDSVDASESQLGAISELQSGPIALGNAQGWGQTLTAEQEGRPIRLRTATIRSGAIRRCSDWVNLAKTANVDCRPFENTLATKMRKPGAFRYWPGRPATESGYASKESLLPCAPFHAG